MIEAKTDGATKCHRFNVDCVFIGLPPEGLRISSQFHRCQAYGIAPSYSLHSTLQHQIQQSPINIEPLEVLVSNSGAIVISNPEISVKLPQGITPTRLFEYAEEVFKPAERHFVIGVLVTAKLPDMYWPAH